MILLVVTTLIAGLFAACGGKSPGEKDDLRKITVILDWYPNTNHTGMYVAQSKGYYKEEGLDVKFEPTEGGAAALVAADKGEFGISIQEEVTYARTADNVQPVKAIAAIIQHNTSGFASPAEKNIKTPRDFEGKTYGGFNSPIEEKLLQTLMEKYGADYSKLKTVNIGAMDFFSAMEEAADFSWIYYGWDGVAAEVRNYPLNFMKLQDLDANLDFYTPLIITSEKILGEEPELVRKFLRATAKGYKYCIENPEDAVEALLEASPEIDRDIAVASQKYLAEQYIADAQRWGEMKEEVWENFGNWLYEHGLIERKLDVKEAFTNEYLPE